MFATLQLYNMYMAFIMNNAQIKIFDLRKYIQTIIVYKQDIHKFFHLKN